MLKFAFAERSTKEHVLENLRRFRSDAETRQGQLRGIFAEYLREDDPFPDRVHINVVAYRLVWDHAEANAKWAAWALAQVERWPNTTRPQGRAALMGRREGAVDWGRKTIELCVPVRRLKYEIAGRVMLGRALVSAGKHGEGIRELRLAVEQSGRLGSPSVRWQAQAALGRALYATGDDNGAEQAFAEAMNVIHAMAAGLAPARAARFLAAEPILEALGG